MNITNYIHAELRFNFGIWPVSCNVKTGFLGDYILGEL